MESLWLLIPVSALLVMLIVAVFGWAINRGQFEDLDGEAERILQAEFPAKAPAQGTVPKPLDGDQAPRPGRAEQY